MKIGDLIISKDILFTYDKKRWYMEIWKITGEDLWKGKEERWSMKKISPYDLACYSKKFVKEFYIKYNEALEILYG